MAAPVLQFKRGAFSNLPALKAGEPGFTTDKYDLYVGLDNNSSNNKFFGSHRYWTRETASAGSGINLVESTSGTDYVTLRAPASVGAAVTYIFPGIQGASNSVLTNDGSGNLTWGSGSANPVFTGIATFNTDQVDVNGTVDISGITTISNTTDSTSKDTGALIVEGGVGIEKSVHIGAALSVTSNLYVGGQSEFVGVVTFRGGTISIGDANTDDVVIGGEFASNLIPTTGLLYDLGSTSKRWADIYARSIDLSGNLNVTGLSTFNGLVVGNNGVSVSGFSTIYDLHVLTDLNVNGSFDVDQTFNASGNAVIAGITSFTNGTQSNSYDDGAVVIDGGLGVQKNVNIGGALNVTGNVTIGGTFVSLKGQDVFIENKDFILGYTTSITPNDDTANHAGVAIASTEGSPLVSFTASGINTLPNTYKQLMWFKNGTLGFATDAFAFNYALAIGTTTMANGVVLAVGSGVTASNNSVSATNLYGNGLLNNLNVSGLSTFVGVSTFQNNVYIGNQLYVGGVNISGGASVGEDITTRNIFVSGISTFLGAITGTASTATRAVTVDTVTASDNNASYHLTFVDSHNGSASPETVYTDDGIFYNPGTNTLTTQHATFTGDIAVNGGDVTTTSTTFNLINGTATNVNFAGAATDLVIGSASGITTISNNLEVKGDLTITGNDIKSSGGTTAITLSNDDVTIQGDLVVLGTQTIINTETLKVEDSLIEVGLVNSGGSLVPPSADANIDVGVIFHYYTSSAKKAGVYWDDSVSRVVISSDLSESTSVITSSTYAALEIGSLWVTDCAGTSQVVSCTGSERFLENITVDAGTF